MAQVAKRLKNPKEESPQLELIPTSNHNPFWQSSLFNEVYLLNDVPHKYKELWELDEAGPFYIFCNQFRNLCVDLKDVDFESWSERNTINRIIKPILKMLGYEGTATQEPWAEDEPFTVREGGETKVYKPDLIIVNDPKELKYIERKKGDEKLEEARSSVIVPIEAKYWGRIEDVRLNNKEDLRRADKRDQTDAAKSFDFDEQCLKYMEILNKDYGILTDGKTWRLYNRELSSDNYRRNFQFNLGHLIKFVTNSGDFSESAKDYEMFVENAKYFFHLFSKQALFSEAGDRRFVDELLEYSKKYAGRVEEDLKERFVKAMAFACNGFLRSVEQARENVDLFKIRNVAESHLFNILFIKHCESRNILPLKQSPEYRKISVSNAIDKLEHFNPEREEDDSDLNIPILKRMFSKDFPYTPDGTELYERLLKLTKMVQDGTRASSDGFEIKGFHETVFSREEWKFVQSHRLKNSEMVNILFELGYCISDVPGKKYQQIPYNFFAPRQLGSIYESFLEFKIERAREDMAFLKRQWVPANLKSDKMKRLDVPKVKRGNLFFTPDNEDRKATGSYYTPECVVQFVLAQTIGVQAKGKSSNEILKMRVCDPAMGSGHFLSGALNYIARIYLARLDEELNDDLNVSLVEAKQRVLHNCIFGVDINSRAVKLAKMSLWMESASSNSSLESLEDQLKNGNSVLEDAVWKEWGFLKDGIDVVVGNPPYLGEKGNKELFQKLATGWLGKRFYQRKVDLFYLFFHLGIDILRPGGHLGFITTNYFPTSTGGTKLRKDFHDRTTMRLLLNLNEVRVFGDASGQHNMVTVLSKGREEKPCLSVVTSSKSRVSTDLLSSIMAGKESSTTEIEQGKLYDGDEFYIRVGASGGSTKSRAAIESVLAKIRQDSKPLGELVNINQGIVSGCDKVSNRHLKMFPKLKAQKGEGIFILTKSEVDSLRLSKKDKDTLIRPFFKNSDIDRFSANEENRFYLIFSNHIRNLSEYPSVRDHFNRFKCILTSRSQMEHCLDWWDLHAIRMKDKNKTGEIRKMIFDGPKIISPQRSKLNKFAYSEGPWYASADVYYMTATDSSPSLKYLTGLLNSKVYLAWLYFMGKRKGEMLELYQKPLSEVPIKLLDQTTITSIVKEVDKLIDNSTDKAAFDRLNRKFYDALKLSTSEISAIEDFYESRETMSAEDPESEDDEAA